MQSSKAEKIYIDSSVWFSYITKGNYDKDFTTARDIINDIVSSNKTAVISGLVILEVINIIRKRIAEREPFIGPLRTNDNVRQSIKSKIDRYTKEFIDKITKWEGAHKLIIMDSQTAISEIFKTTHVILNKTFGEITEFNHCRICRRSYNSYSYRGIDHYDIQHALLAKESISTEFITFDRGYRQLQVIFPNLGIKILNTQR